MVEKAGHKTTMRSERLKWIDEGRPKSTIEGDDENREKESSAPRQPDRIAPIFEKPAQTDSGVPDDDDLFGDDIYSATPRKNKGPSKPAGDVPDDDDLDALMAEAEASSSTQQTAPSKTGPAFGSIFGGGLSKGPPQPDGEPDEDELDALMAEADPEAAPPKPRASVASNSMFGGGNPKPKTVVLDDDDDLEALVAEAEAQAAPKTSTETPNTSKEKEKGKEPQAAAKDGGDDDDLDALIAEVEVEAEAEATALAAKPATAEVPKTTEAAKPGGFEDEEEAMAEMDGLW